MRKVNPRLWSARAWEKRLATWRTLAALGMLGFVGPTLAAEDLPANTLQRGIAEVRAGDHASAVVTLDGFIRSGGDEPGLRDQTAKALLYQGLSYVALGQETLAAGKLRQAIDISPSLANFGSRREADFLTVDMRRALAEAVKAHERSATITRKAGGHWWTGPILLSVAGAAGGVALSRSTPTSSSDERANQAPAAGFSWSPSETPIQCMTAVTFAAQASDPDGDALAYLWSVDGTGYRGPSVTHVFRHSGDSSVMLTVADGLTSTFVPRTVPVASLAGHWRSTSAGFYGLTDVVIGAYTCDRYVAYPDVTANVNVPGQYPGGVGIPPATTSRDILLNIGAPCFIQMRAAVDAAVQTLSGPLFDGCTGRTMPFTLVRQR